jgi:hypothetical protein
LKVTVRSNSNTIPNSSSIKKFKFRKSKKKKKRKKLEMELKGVPRVMIEHIADLDVHGPIWTDQHIARGSVHHRIHHLRFSVPIHQNQLPVSPPRSLEISPILRKIPATLSLSLSLFLSLRDRLVFYFSVRGNFGYFVFLFPFRFLFRIFLFQR